jgi:uncharacterized membrane protein
MKKYIIFISVFLCAASLNAEDKNAFNSELKRRLSLELSNLQTSMMDAKNEIAQLRRDKAHIDAELQEQEKNNYYEQIIEANQKTSDVQAQVDTEIEKSKATLLKYRRVKSILGYIFGLVLSYLYIRLGAQALSTIASTLVGPWAFALRFAGPVLAFGAGYLAVNLVF